MNELVIRLISFLNCHGMLKIHPEHHELFHRSLVYFIENKMFEIGVPIKNSGVSYNPNTIPMPTIQSTKKLVSLGLDLPEPLDNSEN